MATKSYPRYVHLNGAMVQKTVSVRVNSIWLPLGDSSTTAEFYLNPLEVSLKTGDTLDVQIRENSYGNTVNALQANVSYSDTLLQFNSADTTGGAFTTTVQNTGGSGLFQLGVAVLGGSVTGDQLVGTIHFTALASGTASLTFATGSGIASADTNTNICNQQVGASYTIS